MSRKSRLLILSAFVVVADLWTKWLVESRLALHESLTVIPSFLDFTHVRNSGVAFGLMPTHGAWLGTLLLAALGLVALGVIAYYFHRTPAEHTLLLLGLALILGGAVGNLIDRVAAGAVTDFIDVYVGTWHWYTFNIADSAITIGIALMACDLLIARRRGARADATG